MTFTAAANMTKAGFQMEIKKKQGLFNRFKKRFNVAKTTGEKQFLKAEACRIVNELKQCCKTWKNCGWGTCNWITKNFTTSCFNNTHTTMHSHSTKRNNHRTTGRTTRHTTSSWRNTTRSRSNSRNRSYSAPRNYVAW